MEQKIEKRFFIFKIIIAFQQGTPNSHNSKQHTWQGQAMC